MEALLLANIQVDEQAVRELAVAARWPCATTWPRVTCRRSACFWAAKGESCRQTNGARAELNLASPEPTPGRDKQRKYAFAPPATMQGALPSDDQPKLSQ